MSELLQWIRDWAEVFGALGTLVSAVLTVWTFLLAGRRRPQKSTMSSGASQPSASPQVQPQHVASKSNALLSRNKWVAPALLLVVTVSIGTALHMFGSWRNVVDLMRDTQAWVLDVIIDSKPQFGGSASIPAQSWTRKVKIEPLVLPRAEAGNGSLGYNLTPTLPTGLLFDPKNLQIRGTPSGILASTEYSFVAIDEDGDKATLTFSITINYPPPFPRAFTVSPSYHIYSEPHFGSDGIAFESNTLLNVVGKVGRLEGSPQSSWWEVVVDERSGFYFGNFPIYPVTRFPERERSVVTAGQIISTLDIWDRDDDLIDRIPTIEGGIFCDELVRLLKLLDEYDRDDVLLAVAPHLRHPYPWRCEETLLDLLYRDDADDVAAYFRNVIPMYSDHLSR